MSNALKTLLTPLLTLIDKKADRSEIPRVPTKLSELKDDSTHRTVSDSDMEYWSEGVSSPIGTDRLEQYSVTEDKLAASSVTTQKLAYRSVTAEKIAMNSITQLELASGAVTTDKLADGAITKAKMSSYTVGSNQLLSSSVTTDKLANDAVTTDKLANGAVTANKLATSAVTTDKLADGAVTANKLATSAVTTDKLANRSITAEKLAYKLGKLQIEATDTTSVSGVIIIEPRRGLPDRILVSRLLDDDYTSPAVLELTPNPGSSLHLRGINVLRMTSKGNKSFDISVDDSGTIKVGDISQGDEAVREVALKTDMQMVVTMHNPGSDTATCDKTSVEIAAAVSAGIPVIGHIIELDDSGVEQMRIANFAGLWDNGTPETIGAFFYDMRLTNGFKTWGDNLSLKVLEVTPDATVSYCGGSAFAAQTT